MTSERDLQSLLAGLFPDDVAVVASIQCPPEAALLPPEQQQTTGMVPKRVREFTHGRHCARQAMRALGMPAAGIGKHDDRSPVWPAGVSGSISHTGELAAAVIGHANQYRSLGLDIEDSSPLDGPSRELILRPDEQTADGTHAKLLFSIKEAIYKCLYPLVNQYIDFQEMTVDLDMSTGRYHALPQTDKVPADVAARLEGRYAVSAGLVVAAAWMRNN